MPKTRFDVDMLSHSAHEVARLVPGRLLGGWLARAMIVPGGWVALLLRAGADALLVAAGKRLIAKGANELLFVRTTPVPCSAESDLQSADGYPCRGFITVPIRILPDASELSAFRKSIFSSGESLAAAGLQRYLQPSLRRALERLASEHPVSDLLKPLGAAIVAEVIEAELLPRCMAGGLVIEGPANVRFESPAYSEHSRRQAELKRREQHATTAGQIQRVLAAAQEAHLTHLTHLLERMRQLEGQQTGASVAQLLRTFSEPERAQMYAALWELAGASERTRWVAVASANEILLFEPTELQRPARRVRIPENFGPLRSLSMDERCHEAGVLLAGAGVGVHLLDAETGSIRQSLGGPGAITPHMVCGGINAAAMSDDHIYATHSELGVLAWPYDGEGDGRRPRDASLQAELLWPEITLRADTVRCARVAEGSLWFTTDELIHAAPLGSASRRTTYTGSESPITALAITDGVVYAGNSAGQLFAWDIDAPSSHRTLRPASGEPIESIHTVVGGGVPRLIIADRSHGLIEIVIGEGFSREYASGALRVRRGAAAEDLLAAINDNRDRLVVWNPRKDHEPAATVIVPHITGQTIQDICLLPA